MSCSSLAFVREAVLDLDSVDIEILRALGKNCRASYQEMSRDLGMTANAVKKRVGKLVESGTIHSFVVYLSFAMADVEAFIAIVTPEGTQTDEGLLERITANPHVYSAGQLSDGPCIAFAEFRGASGREQYNQFLSELPGVSQYEIHAERVSRGNRVEFTPLQIRVLKSLIKDPRMAATEIAEETGLTPRRVRRILEKLIEGGGLNFVARLNLNAGPGVIYYAQIIYDDSMVNHDGVKTWLDKEFAGLYFDSHCSDSAPMMLSLFVVDHLRDAEPLSRRIEASPMIKSVRTIFPFPTKKNVRLQRRLLVDLLNA